MTASPPQRALPFDKDLAIDELRWRVECYEADPPRFEQLFVKIAERAYSGFHGVSTDGNQGDAKLDGWIEADGHAFQVYSPDRIARAQVTKKITEDFTGAKRIWKKRLRAWTFVYNSRSGPTPAVISTLQDIRAKNRSVKIESMSEQDLWSLLSKFDTQTRSEILGPPLHALLDRTHRRIAIIHDVTTSAGIVAPISEQAVIAVAPKELLPVQVSPRSPVMGDATWEEAFAQQEEIVREILGSHSAVSRSYSVFSIAPIPLVVHLGRLLGDHSDVQSYQYDRIAGLWSWPEKKTRKEQLLIHGIPESVKPDPLDVALVLNLSARVDGDHVASILGAAAPIISISTSDPSRLWLRSSAQLDEFRHVIIRAYDSIAQKFPRATVHLFAAAPTPVCLDIGRFFNPNMHRPLALYQFNLSSTPPYLHVKTI